MNGVQSETLVSVHWESGPAAVRLAGTVTVAHALAAAFGYFVIGDETFQLEGNTQSRTTVRFPYSGDANAEEIIGLFRPDATLIFAGQERPQV